MKKWQLFALVSGLILILSPLTVLAMGGTVPGPNRTPVANAGRDQTVEVNNMVFLDGSDSFDPEEDMLTYQWELLAVPQGAIARLTGERGMTTCCFSPDAVGVWIICLTVCDGELVSERDVMQVRVKEPPPTPTKPDFKITDIRAFGIYEGKYFKKFSAIISNKGCDYIGPLEFRVIGLDKLTGGKFTLDERVTIDNFCLTEGKGKCFTLIPGEVEWPEDVPQIAFGVSVDPDNKIDEIDRRNNFKEKTLYRDRLHGLQVVPQPSAQPDIVVTDIDISGISNQKYINKLRVKVKNDGLDYLGPLDFNINVLHKAVGIFSEKVTVDNICLRQSDQKWLTLVEREIEWPEDAYALRFYVCADPRRKIDDSNRDNNVKRDYIYKGRLLGQCNVTVSKTIRVRDYHARMYGLKEGDNFVFDCSGGDEFDFFITLKNFCHTNNTVELSLVYDWMPLKDEGENIKLKKGLNVSLATIGDHPLNIIDVKIPQKRKFEEEYTTFAILSRHKYGYDVLFTAPVKILRRR